VLLTTSCGDDDSGSELTEPINENYEFVQSDTPRQTPATSVAELGDVADSSWSFVLDLFPRVAEPNENTLISPVSIRTALMQAYAGAKGQTKEEVRQALHLEDEEEETLHDQFNAVDQRITALNNENDSDESTVEASLANSVWPSKNVRLKDDYLVTLAQYYGAGIRKLNYSAPPTAREAINHWVSVQTNGKIPELIRDGELSPDTLLTITNTLYFKAAWDQPFSESVTRPGDFDRIGEPSVSTDFMSQRIKTDYGSGDGWQALQLDFAGRETAMLFVLPDSGNFEDFESELSSDTVSNIVDSLSQQEVDVVLPTFKFRNRSELTNPLMDMGMELALGSRADFSGMLESAEVFIGGIIHECFVHLHEGGVEAAAATAVTLPEISGPPEQPASFKADRPFYFFIVDKRTLLPLFAGRLVDPPAE
jgi:serpin B